VNAAPLALFSVADTRGLTAAATRLAAAGYRVVAGGATAQHLAAAGVQVLGVEQLTGVPPILDGRIQALHPAVFCGIGAHRSRADHVQTLATYGVAPIDVVVANLRPVAEIAALLVAAGGDGGAALEHADVESAALLRAAAGNFQDVLTLTDPDDYEAAIDGLVGSGLDFERRKALAAKAFVHLARHDRGVAAWLHDGSALDAVHADAADRAGLPVRGHDTVRIDLGPAEALDGGENPHQSAWRHFDLTGVVLRTPQDLAAQAAGLPYDALMDVDAAWAAVCDLPPDLAGAIVVRHGSPCGGAALTTSAAGALLRAIDCDPAAVVGGVLAVNRIFDLSAARAVGDRPLAVVVAPAFDEEVAEWLSRRPDLRAIALGSLAAESVRRRVRVTTLGVLIETPDDVPLAIDACPVVTRQHPGPAERKALDLAWRVAKHVRSNAIVIADEHGTIGIGAGQVSRVDAAVIAVGKCRKGYRALAAASDGQLSGPEAIDILARSGLKAFVQPGGSARDAEVAAAADRAGIAMVVTGVSHYRH